MERDQWDEDSYSEDYLEEDISLINTQLFFLPEVAKDQSNPIQFQKNIEVVVEEQFRMVVHEAIKIRIGDTKISQLIFKYKQSRHKQVLSLILLKNILTQYENSQNMLSSILKKVDLVLLLKISLKPLTKKQLKRQIFHMLLLITQRRDNPIYEHVVKKNLRTVNLVVGYMLESKEKIFNQFALAICHRLLQEQSSVPFIKYFFKQKMLTRVFQVIKKIKHHSKILCGIIYETTNHQTDYCYSKPPYLYFCEKQMANILKFLVHSLKKQNSNFMTLNIIRNNCLELFEHYNSKEFVLKNKKVFLQLLVISKDFLEEFKLMFKSVLHFNLLSRSEIEPYLRIYGAILNNQYQETICTDIKILILILNLEGVIIRRRRVLEPLKQIVTRVLEIIEGRINNRQDYDNMITLFQSLLKSSYNILVEKNYKQIAERCGDIFNHIEETSADRVLSFITECFNPILFNFYRQKMGKHQLSSIQAYEIADQYYNKFGLKNVVRLSVEARK